MKKLIKNVSQLVMNSLVIQENIRPLYDGTWVVIKERLDHNLNIGDLVKKVI
jgi:hypothetical protein